MKIFLLSVASPAGRLFIVNNNEIMKRAWECEVFAGIVRGDFDRRMLRHRQRRVSRQGAQTLASRRGKELNTMLSRPSAWPPCRSQRQQSKMGLFGNFHFSTSFSSDPTGGRRSTPLHHRQKINTSEREEGRSHSRNRHRISRLSVDFDPDPDWDPDSGCHHWNC